MVHPFLSDRRYLVVYYLIWVLTATIQGLFLYSFFKAPALLAIADAFVFALMYSILGLGLWYTVRFSKMEEGSFTGLLINHLTAVSITLVIWLSFGYYSLLSVPYLTEDYASFFNQTLVWRILFGLVYYILLMLVYYVILYYLNYRDKILRETELKTSVKVAELSALKAQINPHFLFNSLNSISSLTLSEPAKAQEMVVKLSEFLRSAIREPESGIRPFSEELDNILRYLEIEKVRFGDRLLIEQDVAKKCHEARVPAMILQPLVENAIKHGLGQSLEPVHLHIRADCFHGFLKVRIENNYDPEVLPARGTGLGLQNIAERMRLSYGRDDLVSLSKDRHMFRVTLNFPQG